MKYQPIIGLEIHIELKTKSKMFCGCLADHFAKKPNTQVCPVCLGLPGALPVANKRAIEWTVLAGLALECRIPLLSKFDRKNYFYPDLPKGYQVSQYDQPFAINGELQSRISDLARGLPEAGNNQQSTIRIRRVHLEEDTAKLIHTSVRGKKCTLIDFNRSGVPLMEIVTEPDLRSPQEAKEFLKKLQQIVRYLGVSDCDMEKGSMRCEANVSLTPQAPNSKLQTPSLPDYKVEIKNLNSFRFVEKALVYEITRQGKLLRQGKKPRQETRGWDEIKQVTYPQRWKEKAQDYRYFPEPDLPPIRWTKKEIETLRNSLPELPDEKMSRFQKKHKLSQYQARILTDTREKADSFEETVKVGKKHKLDSKAIANVIINKRVDPAKFLPAELIQVLVKKQTRPSIDDKKLAVVINQVLKANQKAVADYKKGKASVVEFLVGQVMRETKGRADPEQVRQEIIKMIKINK